MRNERGDTLVEILVALGLLGLVVAAIAGALIGSASASTVQKETVTLDAALRSFAASIRTEVGGTGSAGVPFDDCATADGGARPYQLVSQPVPSQGPSGTVATVFVTGLKALDRVVATVSGTTSTITSVPADTAGDVTLSIPVDAAPGEHALQLTDEDGLTLPTEEFTVRPSGSLVPTGMDGYGLEVEDVQWWNGAHYVEAGPDCSSPSAPREGLQLVKLLGSAPGGTSSSLTFALANPGGGAIAFQQPLSHDFIYGTPGVWTVRASGYPTPAITPCGATDGLGITDNGDGSATITYTPSPSIGEDVYDVCVSASNGVSTPVQETLQITVGGPPSSIKWNPDPATFDQGQEQPISVWANGFPTPISLTDSPSLDPACQGTVSWFQPTGSGTNTATIAVPPGTAPGQYTVCAAAKNADGETDQEIGITIRQTPVISGGPWYLQEGRNKQFPLTITGYPPASQLSIGGACTSPDQPFPAGRASVAAIQHAGDTVTAQVLVKDAGSMAPPAGQYGLCISATNGTDTVSQAIDLVIGSLPGVTLSGNQGQMRVGQGAKVVRKVTGWPPPSVSVTSGSLPQGLSLDATADVIEGVPTQPGIFTVTLTATNVFGSSTPLTIQFDVENAPAPPP